MGYQHRQKQPPRMRRLFSRTKPWIWWGLAVLIVCPIGVWALIRSTGQADPANAHVGQVVKLGRAGGVAQSKRALEVLLHAYSTKNHFTLTRLVSAGQAFTPPVGTSAKITYIELFQDMMIFQVTVLTGRYKGRSGWVSEDQILWDTPRVLKNAPFGIDDDDDGPLGVASGMASGMDDPVGSDGGGHPDQ